MSTMNEDLLEAKAINRLICSSTGMMVGVEYVWNNGEIAILWLDGACEEIERHSIDSSNMKGEIN